MNQTELTETLQLDAEAPDLIVDGLGRTIAILCSHGLEGTEEERQAKQLANGQRIVAAVNAYGKDVQELLDAKDAEIERLKQKLEAAEAKWAHSNLQQGQIVRVDAPRYHGEGLVEFTNAPLGVRVGVRLENDNVWQYEGEHVRPIDITELPERHWIKRRMLPREHQATLDAIAEGMGLQRLPSAAPEIRFNEPTVAELAAQFGEQMIRNLRHNVGEERKRVEFPAEHKAVIDELAASIGLPEIMWVEPRRESTNEVSGPEVDSAAPEDTQV